MRRRGFSGRDGESRAPGPRRSRPHFGALVLAVRDGGAWRYVGHVGTGFSHAMLGEIHAKLWPLRMRSSPFKQRVKDEANAISEEKLDDLLA